MRRYEMNKIKVLVADDHTFVRLGIYHILSLEEDMVVVGEATNGEECLQKIKELSPDVTLIDANLPNMDGIHALRRLKEIDRNAKAIILTVQDRVGCLYEASNSGADGYIVKDVNRETLIKGIREVYDGRTYVHSSLYKGDKNDLRNIRPDLSVLCGSNCENLTEREYEVLTLLADGFINRSIAEALYISEKTVKNHLSNIYKKIQVRGRVQAAIFAYRHNIRSLEYDH